MDRLTHPVVVCTVLGTPTVSIDGRRVPLGRPLQVQTWSLLLAARGRRLGDDFLIDCLWPEGPPPAAVPSLRAYVSRLRKELGGHVIVREHGGYRIPRETVDVDADTVQGLYEQARTESDPYARACLLDRALDAWQDDPYAGIPDEGPVAQERARLHTLHDLLRVERLAAIVDTGQSDLALPSLRTLSRESPERERVWELLALALYRSGAQTEALAVLREARTTLLYAHGLDPGPGIRRLEAAILRHDPGLMPEAPGPASSDATASSGTGTRRHVPTVLSSFVGRREEQQRLAELLRRERLVTVVALGGMGKTRLAIAVADQRRDPDGPWFVDLSALHAPELLAETIASTLGLLPDGGTAGLAQALRTRETLLVLDNCEHLLGEVATVTEQLLGRCPGVRVLATSRAPLGVDGECVVDLGPLREADAAVDLFRDRAGAHQPPDLDDADALARIGEALEGLPLAIELAAAQCRVLTVGEVAEQLRDRSTLLQRRQLPRSRRARGESLAAVVQWTVDRLEPADRAVFCEVAVFDGGFDLAAARAVTRAPDLVGSLLSLVDAGLLTVEGGSGRRYRMLETLRAHAWTITDPATRSETRAAHRRWFADLVAAAAPHLRGADAGSWSQRLELELPNARTALASAVADRDGLAARAIAGELGWFWFRRAHVAEGIGWSEQALALPGPGPEVEPEEVRADQQARGRTLLGAGLLHYLAGAHERLLELGQAARETAAACGDAQTESLTASYLAYFLAYAGQVDAAREASAAAETLSRAGAPAWTLADVLMIRGQLLRALSEHRAALDVLEEAAAIAEANHHAWSAGSAMWIAGKVALDLGDAGRAVQYAARAARIQADDGDVSSWLVSLHLLAGAAALDGRGPDGGRLLGAVERHGGAIGFAPEAMDPQDSARNVAAVESALTPDEATAARRDGRDLGVEAVMDLVDSLARSVT